MLSRFLVESQQILSRVSAESQQILSRVSADYQQILSSLSRFSADFQQFSADSQQILSRFQIFRWFSAYIILIAALGTEGFSVLFFLHSFVCFLSNELQYIFYMHYAGRDFHIISWIQGPTKKMVIIWIQNFSSEIVDTLPLYTRL